MRITYANRRIERYFADYAALQRKLPIEWVRSIKKHIDRLKASETFGIFLKLNLGQPEPLTGNNEGKYSLHIAPNARLIIMPSRTGNEVMICEEVMIKGVVDYHGSKENWYIS